MDRTDDGAELLWGRYRLDRLRLAGDRFAAFTATDTVLKRTVVVKRCRFPAGAGLDLQREEAAARRTAALAHHGIVPLLDIGLDVTSDGGRELGLVFEWIDGRSIARTLAEDGPMTARQVAYLGFDVAEALEYLHVRGVVVRGVTPSNVVLDQQTDARPHARLLDLSMAVPAGSVVDRGVVTLDDSPRAADGRTALPADDVRALGLLLIEGLLGAPAESVPGAPDALAALLAAMTSADPAERPTSTQLAVAFRELVAREFGRHRRVATAAGADAAEDEEDRLAALHRYDLLDTPPEGAFDRITDLASRTFGVPVSTVSIVDRDRIWFKSHHGVDAEQIGRDPGLCAAVVQTGGRIAVPDAKADASTRDNPLIAGDDGLQCYVGVPLTSVDGYTLGALSIADYRPREFTPDELETLDELGRLVTHEMEMRLAARRAVLARS